MSIDILASMFDISWFFQGIEDFKKIVLRNFIVKITGVILIFLFVQSSEDLSKYVLCHSLTLILGNLSMWMYIPTFVHRVKLNSLKVFRHIKPTVILFFPQIASSIYTTLDKTMIGFLTSSEVEVAYYEQSQKIVKIVMTIVTSLGTVMMPRIANLYKTNETEIIRQYLNKSIKFTFFLSFPMMFGLIALSSNIVPWFFGNGYEKVIPNMMFISPVLICISFSNLMGVQYLLPLGRQKEFTISIVTGTILNVLINIILIPFLFSIGAAIATVVAEFGVSCVQLYYLRKDFNLLSIIKENVIYVFSSFVMFIPVYFISNALKSSIINSVFCCICGIVIYSLMLLIFGDKLLLRFIKKMLSKVMKT